MTQMSNDGVCAPRMKWNTMQWICENKTEEVLLLQRWKRIIYNWALNNARPRNWNIFVVSFFWLLFLFFVWMMITLLLFISLSLCVVFSVSYLSSMCFEWVRWTLDTGFWPFDHNNLLFELTYNCNWCLCSHFQSVYLYGNWRNEEYLSVVLSISLA